MSILRIIFILSNIFENINGVSTKYIKFIEYLSNINYLGSKIDIILFLELIMNNIINTFYIYLYEC